MDRNNGLPQEPMFGNLASKGLKLIDILIYFTIASFEKTSNLLTPTYKELAHKSGCSINVVKASIKRLSRTDFLKVTIIKKHIKKRAYELLKATIPRYVPTEVFQTKELTPIQKASLLLIVSGASYWDGGCPYKIARAAGIGVIPFRRNCKVLHETNYILEEFCPRENNQWEPYIFMFTSKVDWEPFLEARNSNGE